jgi:hypothetical protein
MKWLIILYVIINVIMIIALAYTWNPWVHIELMNRVKAAAQKRSCAAERRD